MKFGQILVCCITNISNMFGSKKTNNKTLESSHHPNCSKDTWKLLSLFISISWPSLMTLWVLVQKICWKIHPVSFTNTHHEFTDLLNHGIVKNTKTWIFWEQNIAFLWNEKILHLCLRWHILRSYCFVVGETFNIKFL